MELDEFQQMLVTCIGDQLRSGRDRGERIDACRSLQRILMGASLWLEGCRQIIDLECSHEPSFEEHLQGVAQSIENVHWIQV